MSRNILGQGPHATNYFGKKAVGDFLWSIMETGLTMDWRKLLRETTGKDLSTAAVMVCFAPLMEWLREENQRRAHTLEEL
ncbi:MAG: M2 family metallopeptidase [Candidatus Marinimicrobia bacterium]|nr:M2 family metallopeptidase [Candidatus Neomarinimicrobiota bacterium]